VLVEGDAEEEEAERGGDVRLRDAAVREHRRLDAVEEDGEGGRARAEVPARVDEEHDAEQRREHDHGDARPEL
jgi:hypothetical protein